MQKKNSAFIPAVNRTVDIIEFMAASEKDLSLSEILDGCIGIAVTIFNFSSKDTKKFGQMVMKTAKEIETAKER